VIRTNHHYYKI